MITGRLILICCLLLLVSFGAVAKLAPDDNNGLELLKRAIDSTQSLQGRFQQRSEDADGFVMEDSQGDFWFVAPDRFRWQYLEPFEQLIVADGQRVWMHDVELEQVSVRDQASDITESPMALLGQSELIERQFTVQRTESEDEVVRLLLVPRDERGDFDRVLVDVREDVITRIVVRDAFGQVTVLRLESLTVNPELDASLFEFDMPDGVDVVGMD